MQLADSYRDGLSSGLNSLGRHSSKVGISQVSMDMNKIRKQARPGDRVDGAAAA